MHLDRFVIQHIHPRYNLAYNPLAVFALLLCRLFGLRLFGQPFDPLAYVYAVLIDKLYQLLGLVAS
jgi:hypothetical protein